MLSNTNHGGYFLYHSIGMYPGKEEGLSAAMAEYAAAWAAPNDGQWGYVLGRRQEFIDLWRREINAPEGTLTTCESVTDGLHRLMRALPEGMLRDKRVLVAADCFPSLHFLLAGLAPRMGFTLHTVPLSAGKAWVEAEDFIAQWGTDVALALITLVTSTASARVDLAPLVAHGRDMGSLVGVDITQAAGLIPFDAQEPKVDFVLSSSLKWMCGTSGAGVMYIDAALIPELSPEGRGWFSQGNPFSWDLDAFEYAPDIRRFDTGTPSALAAVASVPALTWHAGQDRAQMLAHNRRMVERIITRADALGLPLHSPRDPDARGGTVILRLPDADRAAAMVGALRDEGFSTDSRGALLRLSPGIVTRHDAVEGLFDVMGAALKRHPA